MKLLVFFFILVLYSSKYTLCDDSKTFQRQITILLGPKEETCFFISTDRGQNIELEFMVLNSNPKDAKAELATTSIFDSSGRIVWNIVRKSRGKCEGHYVNQAGEYKVCFKAM